MTVQPAVATPAEAAQVPGEQANGQSSNGTTNGVAAARGPSRLPTAQRWTTGLKLLILGVVVAVILPTGGGAWYYFSNHRASRPDLVLYPVHKEKLLLTVVERG